MRILLLVSAFNGLTQRAWTGLRENGHVVGVQLATSPQHIIDAVHAANPDLILCPFLKERVPAQVWQHWPTIIIYPGPVGDRGPSPLDWAITENTRAWGVTALQAVQHMGAGPIWATRTFPLPEQAPRKSSLYNSAVADAAMACIYETVDKACTPGFTPVPTHQLPFDGTRIRPLMTQPDRAFHWAQSTEHILRQIRAADSTPGVRTQLGRLPVFAYNAHPGPHHSEQPGTIIGRRHGAILVSTADSSIWIGHLRPTEPPEGRQGIKLPATALLRSRIRHIGTLHPTGTEPSDETGLGIQQVQYRRTGTIGWLTLNFYNGAMGTSQCRRLLTALRHATSQDTTVLALRSTADVFSNGIDLNLIEASPDPAASAWANIQAINKLCRQIITCTHQVVITSYTGNAAAGGVMLGLGADIVTARDGIILNPFYDIGLFGSELHTYTLTRRVGAEQAQRLLSEKFPVDTIEARRIGLIDKLGPRDLDAYNLWLTNLALQASDPRTAAGRLTAKRKRLTSKRLPLQVYQTRELAEMSRDIFDNRSGFTTARHAFVTKTKPQHTPARLRMPTPPPCGR